MVSIKEVWLNLTGRELAPKDVERLARLMAAAGIPQTDPLAPILVALTAEYEAMNGLGERLRAAGGDVDATIDAALRKASETAEDMERAAIQRTAAAVATEVDGKKIMTTIIAVAGLAIAVIMLASLLIVGRIQAAVMEQMTAQKQSIEQIADEAAFKALAASGAQLKTERARAAYAVATIKLASILKNMKDGDPTDQYVIDLTDFLVRVESGAARGGNFDADAHLAALKAVAGAPESALREIARNAGSPRFTCTAAVDGSAKALK